MAFCCRDKVPEQVTQAVPLVSAAEQPPLELPPGAPNTWIESKRYRFRVLDVRPCDEQKQSSRYRLGVAVEIEAKPGVDVAPVFASPTGAELVKNGKIFRPMREPVAGCEPSFEPKNLAPGETARGILAFDVPDVAYVRSALFRFKPPRWGFESTASVQLPDCFGAGCKGTKLAEKGEE